MVSIDDIARLAGVSRPTVSKALTGNHHVNPETRERIRALAKQLNFVPSRAAQSLGRGKTGMIGVIYRSGSLPDALSMGVLMGMDRVLQGSDRHLVILTHDAETDDVPVILRQRFLDAVGIFHQRDQRDEAFLLDSRIPFVVINAEPTSDRDCVFPDNRAAMNLVVQHLVSLGHKRIAYVNTPTPRHFSVAERVQGYIEAMATSGLPGVPGFNSHAAVNDRMDELLAMPNRPTALVCFNDQIALESISYLQDRGVNVPAEMSVTGCDDATPWLKYFRPTLTTLRLPFERMGEEAARLLLSRLEQPEQPCRSISLPVDLVVRGSTSAPQM